MQQPIATYRLQLNPAFTLDAAAAVVPYLAALGISHVYTSPSQQAQPGSTSGYDVIDPGVVNAELGGQASHDRLSRTLAQHGLRRMADIVPNHMAISSGNPWWYRVLKHGRASRHATWFDVDWEASEAHWPNRVLLPVLGDQFGRVLDAGELRLSHAEGQFTLHYHDNVFPVEPSSTADMLARVADRLGHMTLAFLAESLRWLPHPGTPVESFVTRRYRDQTVLAILLARLCADEPAVATAIDAEVLRMNNSLRELGELIEQQNYRLAHWRAADLDLGYRRFFNINTLMGLRVELPDVFDAVHALPLQWLRDGEIHALRVDHPDGLRVPTQYMQRLRDAAPGAWIVVEKILAPGEKLSRDWPVDGTTGYDFCNVVQGLFVDPASEEPLTRGYEEFIQSKQSWQDVRLAAKRCALNDLLGSEVSRLTSLLWNICERHWRYRDYTRAVFTQLIVEVAVGFEVYRSYVQPGQPVSAEDRQQIHAAVVTASHANASLDTELLEFMEKLLLLEVGGTLEEEFAQRFQQLTGPAMAKGLEDTAFYRYNRLIALNEVGGEPGNWGCSVEQFHQWCAEALRERPLSLLATSTHDSKRSEDVRARLLVLSEMPQRWIDAVVRWRHHNTRLRGTRVDANAEYLYYQNLVGAWPISVERMAAFMKKAVRECKEHTEWTRVDSDYEAEIEHFVAGTMADPIFIGEVERLVEAIRLPGRLNSLAQTLIKLTAPGVPDIYQGCELWDHSLVDPDNRRPVNFAMRQQLLTALEGLDPAAIMKRMEEGVPKLWLIHSVLQLRQQRPALFDATAAYEPLNAEGKHANHVIAYVRGGGAITIAPRLTATRGDIEWDAQLPLPAGRWFNCLEPGRTFTGTLELKDLLQTVPLALLVKDDKS